MNVDKKLDPPAIKENIEGNDTQITILFGMDTKYLFKNFKKDNIQLTGTWYFDFIESNTNRLSKIFSKYMPTTINMIGTSKSCNGVTILANKLSDIFPDITFRLFLFSPYTFYDKNFFKSLDLYDKLPPTLINLMKDSKYSDLLKQYGDSKLLLDKENIFPIVIYPKYSLSGENIMASRLYGLKNLTMLPLPLRTHSLIHPFWKKIDINMEIEIFENVKKKLPPQDFKWFDKVQNNKEYIFNIYNLVFDTKNFIEKIRKI